MAFRDNFDCACRYRHVGSSRHPFGLCSGLTVDHTRDANELKQVLTSQHLIKTDASEINVYHTYMRIGMVDVGYQIALDD